VLAQRPCVVPCHPAGLVSAFPRVCPLALIHFQPATLFPYDLEVVAAYVGDADEADQGPHPGVSVLVSSQHANTLVLLSGSNAEPVPLTEGLDGPPRGLLTGLAYAPGTGLFVREILGGGHSQVLWFAQGE
jgi:hypothetical protein